MKTKRIFSGLLGWLVVASCSNDELIHVNRDGDEVTFNVVTNAVTRADSVYCNNLLPKQFTVHAKHNGVTYIDEDVIAYVGDKWVNQNGTRYWPKDGKVTFYAHHRAKDSNAEDDINWDAEGGPKVTFTVKDEVIDQVDFIYAKKTQDKPTDGQVTLNFRHALSQIVFKAKNKNPNLYVVVDGVSVRNVKNTGTFTYPNDDTSTKLDCPDDDKNSDNFPTISDYNGISSWGEWSAQEGTASYSVTFGDVSLIGRSDADAIPLTDPSHRPQEKNNAMLLLPQEITPWKPNLGLGSGTYFLVKCKIFNVGSTPPTLENLTDFEENNVCLWGTKNEEENTYTTKNIAIPASNSDFEWQQGKKYIYTFVFGEGNGGYDPNPEGPTPPDPVLLPITFNVTVDEFVPVDETEIEMDTN